MQISKESFNFNKVGSVASLEDAVKNSRYPPAFSYKVIHNGPRKDQLKKCHVSFKLSPTKPAVEISVDVGTYGMSPSPYVESLSLILIYVCAVSCFKFYTFVPYIHT